MTKDTKQVVIPPSPPRVPATRAEMPSLPSLPSSSGKWLGGPSTILEADRHYVEIHAAFLRARADQANAMRELCTSREHLAVAISRLQSLPLVCEHEFIKGKMERASELTLLELKHETAEVQARAALAAAKQVLAAYEPQPPEPTTTPPPPAPAGLTPDEVDELLSNFPDLTPETRHLVALALKGRLNEKTKGNGR